MAGNCCVYDYLEDKIVDLPFENDLKKFWDSAFSEFSSLLEETEEEIEKNKICDIYHNYVEIFIENKPGGSDLMIVDIEEEITETKYLDKNYLEYTFFPSLLKLIGWISETTIPQKMESGNLLDGQEIASFSENYNFYKTYFLKFSENEKEFLEVSYLIMSSWSEKDRRVFKLFQSMMNRCLINDESIRFSSVEKTINQLMNKMYIQTSTVARFAVSGLR